MNFIQSKKLFPIRRPAVMGALAVFSLVLTSPNKATAQQDTYIDYSHPNVTIDLSVIDNDGYQSAPGAAATISGASSGLKLLMPGAHAPTSALHIPTVSGKPLKIPAKPKRVQTATKAPAPAAKKAPAAVAKIAPPPPAAPVEVVSKAPPAKAPKKLEAPAKVVEPAPVVQKSAPAAPVVQPAPKVAKTEAPKAPTPPPAPQAAAPQQAALPAAMAALAVGQAMRVTFAANKTKLPASAKDGLVALAQKMKGQNTMRLQLMAYAGGPSLSSSQARRMSLSRALSIRSFLIESGVRSTRIDVRALGNKTTEEPVNRVDLNVAER